MMSQVMLSMEGNRLVQMVPEETQGQGHGLGLIF